jgi:ElaB/YqjD/DUF883 family membrane-anchored ribosome-binding protein
MTDYDRPNPEVLEDEIERSRERISADLDQLGERLKPQHLKERAQDALEERARRAARRLIEVIRSNPVQTAIGAGVTGLLLLVERGRSQRSTRRAKARRGRWRRT